MPFLRSLDSVSSSQELRSSKTLIGSGATTCDVVIPGDNVLELHALLNLSADKASAKLVPFSTSEAGVCYVNDAVVPREGAIVVHGDRVAFGNPRNVFLFELTPHPQMTALSPQTENSVQHPISANRAFRKALDTLRGDRKTSTPNASVIASIQSNTPAARNRYSVSSFENSAPSKSQDQLSKFLLEASTDSLLSDYVERKLKQRRSSSVGASNQSNSTRRSRSTDKGRQSREERNAAEVEKLRLSQRIREVNDVLNGDMKFQESYLSPSAKSSKSNKPQWANDNNHRLGSSNVLQPVEVEGVDDSDEDNEEEDEDDLPTMMERPVSTSADRALPNLSSSIQTEHSEQESSSHPPKCKEVEEVSDTLDYSLESLPISETSRSNHRPDHERQSYNPPKVRDFFSKAASLGLNDLTRSRSIKTQRQDAAKTALHEKLINQMIRLKRNETMSQAFVGWKRGLRIQSQNRERKDQQLREVGNALTILRRGHLFFRWRGFAAVANQVMICRLEAFQQRCERRLVRKFWAVLQLHRLAAGQRAKLLRGLVIKKATVTRYTAFRRWEHFTQKHSEHNKLGEVRRVEQRKLDVHLTRMSERHYYQRRVQPMFAQIFQRWRAIASLHKKQRQVLRKVLVRGAAKCAQQAWRKWIEVVLLSRQQASLKNQTEQRIKQSTERLTDQHEQVQSSLREDYAHQLQKLMVMIEEKDQELKKLKQQKRAKAFEKTAAKTKWEQILQSVLESAIVKCDEQIAQTSDQLEELLRSAEDDVLAARFGAAQVSTKRFLEVQPCSL
ncbi:hypothetical protein PRNP1_008572 [Phytophthora ramorum]